ncbi:MAG: glycosyltransferase family 2 protein [Bacteroidia bacterium]
MPLLSVITVTYNAEKTLPKTLASLQAQTFQDWELILIDGGSKDKTLSLLEPVKDKISYAVSEPDEGIYDAMNKGLKAARGEYVIFLNAGDALYEPDTLEKIFSFPRVDVYYGDHVYETLEGMRVPRKRHRPYPEKRQLRPQDFSTGMVICHQALVVRRSLAPLYNTAYRYASDLDWVLRLLAHNPTSQDVGQFIIRYLVGGWSMRGLKWYLWERTKIIYRHFGAWGWAVSHAKILAYQLGI